MKNIEPLVEKLLHDIPETRSNDRLLMLSIWAHEGFRLTGLQVEIFNKCSSPETIRRTRQKLQHEGKYLPSEKVQKARKVKAEEMRENFSNLKKAVVFDKVKQVYIIQ